MHPFNGALPGPYVSVWVTRGALVAHRLQYRRTFISRSVSLWNDLVDPVFDGVGLAGFKSKANILVVGLSCSIPTIVFYYFSHFPSFCL